ncbi:hypothetical protein L2E82_14587 [Cichorium intybus]|uniref:Uncharacterized protein n=1 Tax=Cichorium intybus TaxID=13427 RepID=A0ACB9F1K8_CICIN|nr:hypothetical protein L2E82_14587 [Cichorium intybus]
MKEEKSVSRSLHHRPLYLLLFIFQTIRFSLKKKRGTDLRLPITSLNLLEPYTNWTCWYQLQSLPPLTPPAAFNHTRHLHHYRSLSYQRRKQLQKTKKTSNNQKAENVQKDTQFAEEKDFIEPLAPNDLKESNDVKRKKEFTRKHDDMASANGDLPMERKLEKKLKVKKGKLGGDDDEIDMLFDGISSVFDFFESEEASEVTIKENIPRKKRKKQKVDVVQVLD